MNLREADVRRGRVRIVQQCALLILAPAEGDHITEKVLDCPRWWQWWLAWDSRHCRALLALKAEHRRSHSVIGRPRVVWIHHIVNARPSVELVSVQDDNVFETSAFALFEIYRLAGVVSIVYADHKG